MEVSEFIKIDVTTSYIREQSDPEGGCYVFSYSITIRNDGNEGVRLLRRY